MTEVVVRVVHLKQTVMAVRDSRSSGQALPGSDFHKSGIFTGENPPHQHVTKFAPRPHHVMSSVAQLFWSPTSPSSLRGTYPLLHTFLAVIRPICFSVLFRALVVCVFPPCKYSYPRDSRNAHQHVIGSSRRDRFFPTQCSARMLNSVAK